MTNLINHLDNMANDDSSNEDDKVDLEADEDETKKDHQAKNPIQKSVAPISRLRFVTRLAGQYSPSKMSDEKARRTQMLNLISDRWRDLDVASLADDDDDVQATVKEEENDFTNDVKDINEKVLQHDQEQLRGVQFANAGRENLKVVNSYSVSSKSCILI